VVHGLVNRTIQCFVTDTSGAAAWAAVAGATATGHAEYESLQVYPDEVTEDLLAAADRVLSKPRALLLEDIGTWLVTSPKGVAVRRLLRFCGVDFVEFLHSLDDLPGRVRLAVPDLELPALELREEAPLCFALTVTHGVPGFGHVFFGILQAMADDYGALAVLDHAEVDRGVEVLTIRLIQTDYAEAKTFVLATALP